MGDLQPLAPPDPLDPLVVDQPARLLQQPGDLAIAIAAVLPGQCDGVGSEPLFVFTAPRYLALRRTVLSERRTGAALGDRHDRLDPVSYTHLRAHETPEHLVCRLLL